MSSITKYVVDESSLVSIADAIRERTGSSSALTFPNGFIYGITHIYGDTPDMSKLYIVQYNASYQPIVTKGKRTYSNNTYTCWVL